MYARRRLAPVPVVVLAAFVILSSASTRVEYGVGFSLASSYGYVQELPIRRAKC